MRRIPVSLLGGLTLPSVVAPAALAATPPLVVTSPLLSALLQEQKRAFYYRVTKVLRDTDFVDLKMRFAT